MSTLQTTILKHPDSASNNIQFDTAGSSTFAGIGTFSGDLRVQDGGNFRVRIAGNAGQDAILLQNTGAASFAGGSFAIESDGDISTNIRGHGHIELDSSGSFSSPKIKLFSTTGAATLAGNVTVGDYQSGTAGKNGFQFRSFGELVQNRNGGDAYTLYNNSSTKTVTIQASGSATFAGTVNSLKLNGYGFVMANPSNTGHTSGGLYQTGLGQSFLYLKNGFNTATTVTLDGAAGTGAFNGTVSAQGSVLTSDQRFKENITDANPQLVDVTALGNKLRNWDWTADAPVADKDTRFLGLVAQEAETICPGIVTTIARTKDGAELTPEVVVPAVYETKTVPAVLDDKGEVVKAETTEQVLVTAEQVTPATYEQLDDSYKGIKNDILIMKLLGAVAELSAKVAVLEAG